MAISRRTSAASATARSAVQRVDRAVAAEHGELGPRVRVAHRDPGGEPVALRLGQRVRALHLDRVLGRDHHERRLQLVRGAVDRDLPLLHALQQGGLGLRRGPVDLVADHQVGEHRARLELEVALFLVVDADPGHVAGQQVGGELDAPDRAVDAARERLRQLRLADAGHVLDQEVAFGEQDGECQPYRRALALDDLLDVGHDGFGRGAELLTRQRSTGLVPGWRCHGPPPCRSRPFLGGRHRKGTEGSRAAGGPWASGARRPSPQVIPVTEIRRARLERTRSVGIAKGDTGRHRTAATGIMHHMARTFLLLSRPC